jgi:uncharacterized membrane protein YeiB
MWMPKDTATWLALIALILVIPFNFFSSWAYPKLQDWWAARSRRSLEKRLEQLKAALADMYTGRAISLGEDWILMSAEKLGSLIYWGVNTIVLLAIVMTVPPRSVNPRPPYRIIIVVPLVMTGFKIVKDYLMAEIRRVRLVFAPTVKYQLEQSIAELSEKLAARDDHKIK